MQLIRPIVIPSPYNIASHQLKTSNVTETEESDYNIATAYVMGDRVQVVDPTDTVTISATSPAVVTWTAHSLPNGTMVRFTTTGSLPSGITAGRVYYVVRRATNTFQISLKPNGTPINASGAQSGTHTGLATVHNIYEALASTTGDHPLISPTKWVLVDATNRWRMHSGLVSSQTSNFDTIDNTYTLDERANTVVLLNVQSESVQVIMTDSVDGVVYDQTKSGFSLSGITDFYSWYFEPPVSVTELVFFDLPNYTGADIQVIIDNDGFTASCGALVIGNALQMGTSLAGMSMSIQDFSVKSVDSFGNSSVTERSFRREVSVRSLVDNDNVDVIFNELAKLRAIPSVFIGSDSFGSSIAYGYYRDFNIEVAFPENSYISIEIEGLT